MHSSLHSFRFRAKGVENLLQTTNYFELDTHATRLWTAQHSAPVMCPMNAGENDSPPPPDHNHPGTMLQKNHDDSSSLVLYFVGGERFISN